MMHFYTYQRWRLDRTTTNRRDVEYNLHNNNVEDYVGIFINAVMCTNGSRGIFGIAPHPCFLTNPYIHTYCIRITDGCPADAVTAARNCISRFRMNPTTLQIILSSKLVLLENAPAICNDTSSASHTFLVSDFTGIYTTMRSQLLAHFSIELQVPHCFCCGAWMGSEGAWNSWQCRIRVIFPTRATANRRLVKYHPTITPQTLSVLPIYESKCWIFPLW